MKYIHSEETLEIPEGVKVSIKTRNVVVEGPRGKLSKSLGHLAVSFTHPKSNIIKIELHHGSRKSVATLRTVRTLINNLIIGVTKGYKYKMRYVYAHFPINVNIEKNSATDQYEVEIRNFIGEKIVRKIVCRPGVDVEVSKNQKDELLLLGNVSHCSPVHVTLLTVMRRASRTCLRAPPTSNKSAESATRISESSWTVCTCRSGATSRMLERWWRSTGFFHGHMISAYWDANGRLWG
jgi:large subunit ribosomal protein L9e